MGCAILQLRGVQFSKHGVYFLASSFLYILVNQVYNYLWGVQSCNLGGCNLANVGCTFLQIQGWTHKDRNVRGNKLTFTASISWGVWWRVRD